MRVKCVVAIGYLRCNGEGSGCVSRKETPTARCLPLAPQGPTRPQVGAALHRHQRWSLGIAQEGLQHGYRIRHLRQGSKETKQRRQRDLIEPLESGVIRQLAHEALLLGAQPLFFPTALLRGLDEFLAALAHLLLGPSFLLGEAFGTSHAMLLSSLRVRA
jgi:hypothetical protein